MKRHLIILSLVLVTATTFAQGLINFQNNPATLISAGPVGVGQVINGPPGSYYFALLTNSPANPVGSFFSFSGVYATNQTVAGLFSGGAAVAMPGWQPGTGRDVEIAGWSADLGHDWNPAWLTGVFPLGSRNSAFGLSSDSECFAGASTPSDLFLGNQIDDIQSGFNLLPVPEPSTGGLAALGGATLTLYRRGRGTNPKGLR